MPPFASTDSVDGEEISALPLLVLGVFANHANDTPTSDDPAFLAHLSN
jgi:hypothetical protein